MNYLILDTTDKALSIIIIAGNKVYKHFNRESVRHNSEIIPAIDKLAKKSNINIKDIDVFAAVVGPGSFTGIRVGLTVMNAFYDVFGGKLVEINTFEMITYGLSDVIALIDARNNNFYGAEKSKGRIIRMGYMKLADIDLSLKQKVYRKNIDYSKSLISITREKTEKGEYVKRLIPLYLKDSQAEREQAQKNYKLEQLNSIHLNEVMNIEKASFITPWSQKMFLEVLDNDKAISYVIQSDSKVIGYYSLLQLHDEMHIMKIAVKNSYRRQGYGDLLLKHIIEESAKTNSQLITLEVRADNVAAQTLYGKYGFNCIGTRKNYYENIEDGLIYTLKLRR